MSTIKYQNDITLVSLKGNQRLSCQKLYGSQELSHLKSHPQCSDTMYLKVC